MDQLDLARIQFATTSVHHFFFVPITMGMALLVAVLHTRWPVGVRLGPAVPAGASVHRLDGAAGRMPVGAVHHRGELLDAEPARLRPQTRTPTGPS